ncbi:hypothetical protein CLOSTHATH_03547 [Hungatella hathewayi DSM 13479]|jgi:hypothetical protein|uniref:SnoaL-like domain-containing protein n=2 Tax=Hungatella hathewayi TaxID=154046 RepID=D3AIV7_9FIRM|nr:hypothetical protein CLOSTHATH_03547 [Hungatella hathewayi DSM 13479]
MLQLKKSCAEWEVTRIARRRPENSRQVLITRRNKAMTILEQYIECMKKGDEVALADLFNEYGVLHDSSVIKAGMDTIHLEGKMAVEMMFHHKFGFNGGPFPIHSVKYVGDNTVWYFITYNDHVIPVTAFLSETDENGKIKRLNIYPL